MINYDIIGFDSSLSVKRQEELSEWFSNLSAEDKSRVEDIRECGFDSGWESGRQEGTWIE